MSQAGRKIKIIFNPAARRGHTQHVAHQLESSAKELGGAAWVETQRAGHASQLARQAADEGFEVVAAIGGDGTVHEVVNGLMQVEAARRPALGVVPIGSGNDFVVGAGLCSEPSESLRRIFAGSEMRLLDLGCVSDNTGRSEFFVNVIGIGLDASVTFRTRQVKLLRGFPMYFAALMRALLQDFRAPRMDIAFDDDGTIAEPVMMMAVANGTREGGGFNVTPKADIGDGALDFAMIGPVSRFRLLQIIPDVMKGTHERHREIRMGRLRQLRLSTNQQLAIHFDGEMFAWYGDGVQALQIGVVPNAIRLVV